MIFFKYLLIFFYYYLFLLFILLFLLILIYFFIVWTWSIVKWIVFTELRNSWMWAPHWRIELLNCPKIRERKWIRTNVRPDSPVRRCKAAIPEYGIRCCRHPKANCCWCMLLRTVEWWISCGSNNKIAGRWHVCSGRFELPEPREGRKVREPSTPECRHPN